MTEMEVFVKERTATPQNEGANWAAWVTQGRKLLSLSPT